MSELTGFPELTALFEIKGGKGKKKRKQDTTKKNNKHRHVSVKLHAVSFYAIQQDGSVERVKKLCESETCKGKGIFMANHKNRYYCGKCQLTLMKQSAQK